MNCKKCGSELQENAVFCANCGNRAELSPERKDPAGNPGKEDQPRFCPACGTKLPGLAVFCGECGTALDSKQQREQQVYNQAPVQRQPDPAPIQASVKPVPERKSKLAPILGIAVFAIVLAAAALFLLKPSILTNLPFLSGLNTMNLPAVPAISVSGGNDGSGIAAENGIVAAEATIDTKGGTVVINRKDNPANGLRIDVPEGAYAGPVNFTVSTMEIKSHGFHSDLKLISPVIRVDNGGTYSDGLMKVTVPCTVPKNSIPMAFYYKPDSLELETIPVLDYGSNYVTYGVRHFSDTLLAAVDNIFLQNNEIIETGFEPGIDDFSFVNYGSALAPRGQCAGQSMAAIWYYRHLKAANGPLYQNYDNYGKNPDIGFKTPKLPLDDVMAYRLASLAQKEITVPTFKSRAFLQFVDAMRVANETTFNELAALMKYNHAPQVLVIYKINAAKEIQSCHAIIAYKIAGNKIYVADPNKPGQKDRYIELKGGKFTGYSSADNAQALEAGNAVNYNLISLLGESAINNYDSLKTMWEDLGKRTVADAYFPAVQVKYATKVQTADGEQEVPVSDGYAATVQDLKLTVKDTGNMSYQLFFSDKSGNVKQINTNPPAADSTYTAPLQKGDNFIGIALYKTIDNSPAWYDFQWIRVKFDVPTLDELVGSYDDGNIKIMDVFVSQELRDQAKAKAEAEAAEDEGKTGLDQLDAIGNGCDLKVIEQLDQMKGQSYPSKFSLEKTAENEGKLIFKNEDSGATELPFTYKDGTLVVDNSMAASPETGNVSFTMTGTMSAAYGKNNTVELNGEIMFFTGDPSQFYITERVTGSKPVPEKKP